ncbi:hypothetical protein [Enterococcus faecium]|uniref:hypothetical protein n=1 Tax=Enterococcus faecium TaxID=1352 RepID=UPI0003A44F41|nr:hypothetical protein [Enterococcus faecium]
MAKAVSQPAEKYGCAEPEIPMFIITIELSDKDVLTMKPVSKFAVNAHAFLEKTTGQISTDIPNYPW